jgi:hypothetical protein
MDGDDSLIGAISGINDVAAPDFNEVLTGKMRTWLRTTIRPRFEPSRAFE